MYCLDTNIAVDFLRGDKFIINKVQNLVSENDVFLTSVSLCELFKGAYLSSRSDKELSIISEFVESIGIVDLDIHTSKIFGKEYVRLSKIGKMIPEFDLMIVCTAKAHGLIFVTRDRKHFEHTGVKVEVW